MATLSLGLAAGCGGVHSSYVPTAGSPRAVQPRPTEDVEVFLSRPERPFHEVGMIEVQQSALSSAGANALVNELRRVAGQQGCEGVLLSGANDGVLGHGYRAPGSVRTLKGYRGTCLVFKDTQQHAPPRGGGGFLFDTDVAASGEACARASLQWVAVEPGRFTCSGVPEGVGLRATAALGFCADRLCSVELRAEPSGSGASAWQAELRELRAALVGKYGRPASEEGAYAPDCASDPDACSKPGRFARILRWAWASGERIELVLSVSQTPRGDLAYRTGELLLSYEKGAPLPQPAPAPSRTGL
ncbi:hypothetical protein WMF26_35105 [Sorangium sp. So ce185]|uniref:hypothetical protein n=1 Tax=Sorangium sp. So ce185 TaxID=3133287 RepID=UPI003F5F7FF0